MRSRTLSPLDDRPGQAQLALIPKGRKVDVPMELVDRIKTFSSAIALTIQLSGLEEKEVYLPLGIDAGHWTRITKGDAHFPVNKLNDLCDLCGNEAALIWWAYSRGYGLVMLLSEAERQILELRAELAKEREHRKWAEDFARRSA